MKFFNSKISQITVHCTVYKTERFCAAQTCRSGESSSLALEHNRIEQCSPTKRGPVWLGQYQKFPQLLGMGLGVRCACGVSERNSCGLPLDKASAATFWVPGRCLVRIVNLKWADVKQRVRMSCMARGCLLVPEFIIATTAALSQ